MISFPIIPGVEISLLLLIFLGFAVGVIKGFVGVGGGFLVTPALIIIGLPANFAAGTSLMWVVGSSIIGSLRHRELGNIDLKLGVIIIVSAMGGIELGVRLLNMVRDMGVAEEVVLTVSIVILLSVGTYMLCEALKRKAELDRMVKGDEKLPPPAAGLTSLSQKLQSLNIPPMIHLTRAKITISLWLIIIIGFFTGVLAGLMGVGGGFIMVPSMVYLLGITSFVAVGTDMFQIIFSGCYGALRHAMSGNVEIFTAFVMVLASGVGVQLGALATKYARGVSMRFVLGIAIMFAVIGSILKLLFFILPVDTAWLSTSSIVITFGGAALVLVLILWLFTIGVSYRRGHHVPDWAVSLVARED